MNDDKEAVKAQIRELTTKILASDESGMYSPYEWDIVQLIIEYSIRHHITIPVIKYDLYDRWKAAKLREEKEESEGRLQERIRPLKRRKIDQPTDNPGEADYDYFEDFMEALREEHNSEGDSLVYRLMKPLDYDSTIAYPLVVCLHGSSAVGTDNVKQKAASVASAALITR